MMVVHPWKLVAPWYHWQRQSAQGLKPAQTRPVFQKFDVPNFVKDFVREPQHSLVFKDDVDRVFNVKLTDVDPKAGGPFAGRLTRLFAPKPASGTATARDATLVPTGIRKLYLDTHKRYYLVVCELHCDMPGFPTTTPDQVCQAGFVVRRRSFDYPNGLKKEAVNRLKALVALQAEIAYLEQTTPARGRTAKRRAKAVEKLKAEGTFDARRDDAYSGLATARQDLKTWADDSGIVPVHEGWVKGAFPNIGAWQVVEEAPQELAESVFPLYPLFPDPNIPDHSARGKNIYFGVVPTSSHDTDGRGNARFDGQTLYEIRCFVRRHKPGCPRKDEAPDCHGEVVWSQPTESYQLASPNDLVGTSQRPVTIQMPDLGELAAQAAALPLNKFSPVKVVQPQGLNFSVADGKATGGSVGPAQICFFAIPLITIVAFFVLRLFLPIVVFLFNLYFLLLLKLCIPPSVQIDAGLKHELDFLPPGIDVDADFDVSLNLGFTAQQLNAKLTAGVAVEAGVTGAEAAQLSLLSNAPLLPLAQRIKAGNAAGADGSLDLTASLEYETRVEVTLS
jgi:hypothetical protein